MSDAASSCPVRAPGSRLVFTDDGSRIESASGHTVLEVTELEAIIWRSLDGATTLGEIAADLAEVRDSTVSTEIDRITALLHTLDSHELLSDGDATTNIVTSEDDATATEPEPDATGYDFIMAPYPIFGDVTGRATSLDVLLAVFPVDSARRDAWRQIAESLIDRIGPDRTVWGVKHVDGKLFWELYFYSHRRPEGQALQAFFDAVREAFTLLGGWNAPVRVPENTNLFSFEFEIGADGSIGPPGELDVYHTVEGGASMIVAYRHDLASYRLKNTYELFAYPEAKDDIAARLDASRYAYAGAEHAAADFWLAELERRQSCQGVWCSYKPDWDGAYLCQLAIGDFATLLEEFDYPDQLIEWVDDHRAELDHLRYDFGFDYRIRRDGRVEIVRTGFYGWF